MNKFFSRVVIKVIVTFILILIIGIPLASILTGIPEIADASPGEIVNILLNTVIIILILEKRK